MLHNNTQKTRKAKQKRISKLTRLAGKMEKSYGVGSQESVTVWNRRVEVIFSI